MSMHRRAFLGAASITALAPQLARGQSQPPLRIIVPFSAGSGTDNGARVLADAITKASGRITVVDNKPGAGNVIGSLELVRARPDGNTMMYTTGGHTTNAALMKKLPYDPIADFTPVTLVTRASGFALLVGDKSPFRTIEQFIAAAGAEPGKLTFGSSGIGNTTHLMGVFFCKGVGIDLLHVPFKGTPTNELIGGIVDSAFLGPAVAAQAIRAGQLRGLGISGPKRSPLLPDAPTFAERGLDVRDIPGWTGVFAPPNLPADVLQTLYDTVAKGAGQPSFKTYSRDNGGDVELLPPAPFRAYVTSEIERYRRELPPLGIQLN
ncbi:MAG TPA: tripartite tricarboxylate transporter substrate binding protein [Burkholderiaceae bacterium]|nr:tripartite tricarboxylate transporter substrate binding protein [Burkholderiaceae bacterium]